MEAGCAGCEDYTSSSGQRRFIKILEASKKEKEEEKVRSSETIRRAMTKRGEMVKTKLPTFFSLMI